MNVNEELKQYLGQWLSLTASGDTEIMLLHIDDNYQGQRCIMKVDGGSGVALIKVDMPPELLARALKNSSHVLPES